MVEGALEIMNGIPESQSQFIDERTLRGICKVALNKFTSSLRIYMRCDGQSFSQNVDSSLDVLDVMIGPCDLVSGSFVNSHGP